MQKYRKSVKPVPFLEGCVDECAINGRLVADEYVFEYSAKKWDPRVVK